MRGTTDCLFSSTFIFVSIFLMATPVLSRDGGRLLHEAGPNLTRQSVLSSIDQVKAQAFDCMLNHEQAMDLGEHKTWLHQAITTLYREVNFIYDAADKLGDLSANCYLDEEGNRAFLMEQSISLYELKREAQRRVVELEAMGSDSTREESEPTHGESLETAPLPPDSFSLAVTSIVELWHDFIYREPLPQPGTHQAGAEYAMNLSKVFTEIIRIVNDVGRYIRMQTRRFLARLSRQEAWLQLRGLQDDVQGFLDGVGSGEDVQSVFVVMACQIIDMLEREALSQLPRFENASDTKSRLHRHNTLLASVARLHVVWRLIECRRKELEVPRGPSRIAAPGHFYEDERLRGLKRKTTRLRTMLNSFQHAPSVSTGFRSPEVQPLSREQVLLQSTKTMCSESLKSSRRPEPETLVEAGEEIFCNLVKALRSRLKNANANARAKVASKNHHTRDHAYTRQTNRIVVNSLKSLEQLDLLLDSRLTEIDDGQPVTVKPSWAEHSSGKHSNQDLEKKQTAELLKHLLDTLLDFTERLHASLRLCMQIMS